MKRNTYKRLSLWGIASLLLLFMSACQLPAKTLCVDPDLASCYDTIGHALNQAADGDTIQISADTYNENLYIQKNVSLVGTSEGSYPGIWTVIQGSRSNAPVIHIMLGKTVSLSGLEITGGNNPNGGGGISNNGILTATNVIVDHNTAFGYGGGIQNTGKLTMVDSMVQYNSAPGEPNGQGTARGGGIYNYLGTVVLEGTDVSYNTTDGGGGGIFTFGDLTMTDGNISNNYALFVGGGIEVLYTQDPKDKIPSVRLERVTIDNNVATSSAGGIYNVGGMIALTNVTLSGNWGYSRGGAMLTGTFQGTPDGAGDVTIYASTIANNRTNPGQGGGIANYAYGSHGPTTITVSSTIFADNEGGNCAIGGFTVFQSWDYNISDDATCNLPHHADLMNTDPMLNPLAMNAPGRVKTHALQIGSPADNLSTEGCNTPVDARGVDRGLPCDSGAYEGTEEPYQSPIYTAVVAVNATCRAGPGTIYQAMKYLNAGETHTISGRNPDGTWLKLEICWVARSLLTTDADLQLIPVLEVPPPPTPTVGPQTSCSSWTSPDTCRAAGCTWKYSLAGPGSCK
jgi:hypothetical protein